MNSVSINNFNRTFRGRAPGTLLEISFTAISADRNSMDYLANLLISPINYQEFYSKFSTNICTRLLQITRAVTTLSESIMILTILDQWTKYNLGLIVGQVKHRPLLVYLHGHGQASGSHQNDDKLPMRMYILVY